MASSSRSPPAAARGRWRRRSEPLWRPRSSRPGERYRRLPPGGTTHSLRANSAAASASRSRTCSAPATVIARASSDQPRATDADPAVGPHPAACAELGRPCLDVREGEFAERLVAVAREHRCASGPSALTRTPHLGSDERPPLRIARSVSDECRLVGYGGRFQGLRGDRAVVLAQVGGQVPSVLGARVASGSERPAAEPHQPPPRRHLRYSPNASSRNWRSRASWVADPGAPAELAAEDDPGRHRALTSAARTRGEPVAGRAIRLDSKWRRWPAGAAVAAPGHR